MLKNKTNRRFQFRLSNSYTYEEENWYDQQWQSSVVSVYWPVCSRLLDVSKLVTQFRQYCRRSQKLGIYFASANSSSREKLRQHLQDISSFRKRRQLTISQPVNTECQSNYSHHFGGRKNTKQSLLKFSEKLRIRKYSHFSSVERVHRNCSRLSRLILRF